MLPLSVHGTLIAHGGHGCLITGPSGAGKTRLAIEAMMLGAKFIADDQVQFSMVSNMLMAGPPPGMQGVIELRGIGLARLPDTATRQVVHCVAEITPIESIERLPPAPEQREFLGIRLPLLRIAPPPHSSGFSLLTAIKLVQEGRILPPDWKPAP